ncbi:MAG: hypothetical protein V3S29_11885 [bacterium]
MGIYDAKETEYLRVICRPCDYEQLVFAEVEGIACTRCGNPPTHVCYADDASARAGL